MSSTPQTDALLGQAKTMATMGNPSNAVNTITGAANKFATANNLQQNAAPTAVERFSGLFPTAGNVAGGVGGGILGSILAGEIADPAGGGLVTGGAAILSKVLPYLGGIFGAGTGQTAGKATQNVVQNKPFTNQLGSNFLEGAGSQVVGEGLGYGLSKLGQVIGSKATSILDARDAAKAAEQARTDTIVKAEQDYQQAVKNAQTQAKQTTIQNQEQLNLQAQQATEKARAQAQTEAQSKQDELVKNQPALANAANWSGAKSAKFNALADNQVKLETLGIDSTSPTAVFNHAQNIFSQINPKLDKVLTSQPGADMTGWSTNAAKTYGLRNSVEGINQAVLEASGGSAGEASIMGSNSALEDAINSFLSSHPQYKISDLESGQMKLSDLRDLRSEIGNQQSLEYGQIKGPTGTNVEAKANYNALSKIYDDLTTKLSTPEVNKVIAKSQFNKTEQNVIKKALPSQAAEELINGWNGAKSFQDVNALLQPATQMKNVSREALRNLQDTSTTAFKQRQVLGANHLEGRLEAPRIPTSTVNPKQIEDIKPGTAKTVKPELPNKEDFTKNIPEAPVTPEEPPRVLDNFRQGFPKISKVLNLIDIAKNLKTNPDVLNKTSDILSRISSLPIGKTGKTISPSPALNTLTALGANVSNLSNPGTSNNQGAIMNPAAGAGAPNLGAATQAAAPTGTPSINPNVATPIALMELAAMTDPQIFQQMGGADTLNNLLKPVTAAQTAQSGLNTLYGNLAQGAGSQGGAGTPQLGGLYAQAGGGQGALSGGLSGTLSRLFGGGETSRFRQQLQSEQQALQDALSAAGIKTPVNLPDITSSPQAAAAQLQYYQSLLNQIGGAQPTNSPGGGFIPQSVLNSIPAAQ